MRVRAFRFGRRWACCRVAVALAATVWTGYLKGAAPDAKQAAPAVESKAAASQAAEPKVDARWPKPSDAEQKAATAAGRAYIDQVKQQVHNRGLQLYERKYFLFASDVPRQSVGIYLPYLDRMYVKLCEPYGIDPQTNIWLGKAIIILFADEASFMRHESLFYDYKPPPGSAQGLSHLMRDGRVIISCYAGKDAKYLAGVMVHETAHGFTYRYRTSRLPPNWLNEGISEWIANQVVGPESRIGEKVQSAMERMRQSGSLGGDFFTVRHIAVWQYGAAESMVDYLVRHQPGSSPYAAKPRHVKAENTPFRKLLDGIKDGEPWEASLKKAYGMTPVELTRKYGQSMGIANLRP